MQFFIFDTSEWYVAGVDENGYGPLLGPLIVTGVSLRVKGADPLSASELKGYRFPIPIKDSKELFKRSLASYRVGESVAITVLRICGKEFTSLQGIIDGLSLRKFCLGNYGIEDVDLPAFGGHMNEHLVRYLSNSSIFVEALVVNILMPDEFNEAVTALGNKALLDFRSFMEVQKALDARFFIMGKIGGTSHYGHFFEHLGIPFQLIKESFGASTYKLQDGEIVNFILHADREYLPVTFAGIIGKYLRELIMYSLSRSLGLDTEIPYASGYYHDKRTFEVAEKLPSGLRDRWVRLR